MVAALRVSWRKSYAQFPSAFYVFGVGQAKGSATCDCLKEHFKDNLADLLFEHPRENGKAQLRLPTISQLRRIMTNLCDFLPHHSRLTTHVQISQQKENKMEQDRRERPLSTPKLKLQKLLRYEPPFWLCSMTWILKERISSSRE